MTGGRKIMATVTLCMIVKNEEKYLERCLSAIKPVLDKVDSELIITDTGSTDRTVEIAEKFTDKVIHFEWINDFAAARNTALDNAKGEWFMFLDADEIFLSCDGIISFFNSGEYKNYNAASYIIRNLSKTENGTNYSDIFSPRLVKIFPETKFENAIHEVLSPFKPPYKNISDIAEHYGYFFETEEEKIIKSKRNADLLTKRLSSEYNLDPVIFVQLFEAFHGMNDMDKAFFYLDEGIEYCKKNNSIVLAALYFHKASILQSAKKFYEAIKVCDEYFEMSSLIRPYPLNTDAEIHAIKGVSLYDLKKYDESKESLESFFNIANSCVSFSIFLFCVFILNRLLQFYRSEAAPPLIV